MSMDAELGGPRAKVKLSSDLDNTLVNWAGMIKRMPPAFADKQLFFLKGDEAHSILCITPSQRPNDGRWYAVEGEEKLTSGKC